MKLVSSVGIEHLKKLADPSVDERLIKYLLEIIDHVVSYDQASSKVISSGLIDSFFALLPSFQGELHQQIVSTIQSCANNGRHWLPNLLASFETSTPNLD